jgi:hypothetical protein
VHTHLEIADGDLDGLTFLNPAGAVGGRLRHATGSGIALIHTDAQAHPGRAYFFTV